MFFPCQNKYKTHIFKHIWPIARKTLYPPKNQGGIGLIQSQYHNIDVRIKHFPKLKEETNQEKWVILTRYNLASVLYQLHKDFRYMISDKLIKTEQQKIYFYYEDIMNYIKKQKLILNLQNNSKAIYKQVIQN